MQCLDPVDPVEVVADQIMAWLREKNIDLDLSHDNDLAGSTFTVQSRYHERGRSQFDLRFQLEEQSRQGAWSSTITASADGWVEIDVANSEDRFVNVPRIARYLMQMLRLGDSGTAFIDAPMVWAADRSPALIDLIQDSNRRAPVFVAAMGDESDLHDPFITELSKWGKETYGLAQVIVLHADAAEQANSVLGRHGIAPWTLRTYLPDVDLEDPRDSYRHRWLTTRSLATDGDSRIARMLGSIARAQTQDRSLPLEVTRLHRTFDRLNDRELSEAVRRPSRAPEFPAHSAAVVGGHGTGAPGESRADETLRLVRDVLGLTVIDRDSLTALVEAATAPSVDVAAVDRLDVRMDALRSQIDARTSENDALRRINEDLQIENALQLQEAIDARREVAWARQQLREQGAHAVASSNPPPEETPGDLVDVVRNLPEEVIFTGREKDVQAVVQRDSLQTCAAVAWEAVLAMQDYLRARREGAVDSSFHDYLGRTPDGYRGFPPSKSAENETATTQRQFGDQRLFPVPESVDPSGAMLMHAHIRLGRIGMVSPRLHYHHDSLDGRIIIGYIGAHLTNTQSN